MNETLCDLRGVDKSFGDNCVLKGLNLSLPAGTVTVLMGANGAGKSTLVKILSGVHAAGCRLGHLLGKDFAPSTPSEAIRAGVVTVHQNINDGVIPDLDVASNLLIDRLAEPGYGFLSQTPAELCRRGAHRQPDGARHSMCASRWPNSASPTGS
jgi:simple sugar transport system ATP-binding protein